MRLLFIFISTFFFIQCFGQSQSIFGLWKMIDDNSGETQSIMKIGKDDGKVYGKIVKIFPRPGEDKDPRCTKCSKKDARYNKRILGMNILDEVKKHKRGKWEGKILDPSNGASFPFKMWVEDGSLKIRGYWFFFYRTQTWERLSNSPER